MMWRYSWGGGRGRGRGIGLSFMALTEWADFLTIIPGVTGIMVRIFTSAFFIGLEGLLGLFFA